ncbi:MAG: hypothetical protein U1D00_20545, partial [Mycobacterium sp.]|nr:hypothetical protein [Mycobacterium sp.]
MGRHSLPDKPEDTPDEPRTERFGFDTGPRERDPGHDQFGSGHGQFGSAGDRFGSAGDEFGSADWEPADTDQPAPAGYPPDATPAAREWDSGDWTGSHRAVTPNRRGVSIGVIVALVSVIVVVGVVILWRFFGDNLSDRSDVAAARCVDGEVTVAVVADPAITETVATLAQRYNETAAPVGDRCVKVGVQSADSGQVVDGFTDEWPSDLGERPALWIPASSVSEARLEAAAGAEAVSDSRSLVTSPVVLAVSPRLKEALGEQDWGTLPRLQADPASLDGLGLQGWGALRLALPLDQDSDAAYLAAEAVAAAAAPSGAPATAGLAAVSTLVGGAPELADPKAGTALDALVEASDPASAPVHAVV